MRFRVDEKPSKSTSARSAVKSRRLKERDNTSVMEETEPIEDFDDDVADMYQDDPESDFEGKADCLYLSNFADTSDPAIRICESPKAKKPSVNPNNLKELRKLRSEVSTPLCHDT